MNCRKRNLILILIILSFVVFNNTYFYAQNTQNLEIKTNEDFAFSLKKYAEILSNKFDLHNYFKDQYEAIYYYENALKWAKSKGKTKDIIAAKLNILGIYSHYNNNVEKIARIRDLLKYKEIYNSIVVRDLLYDLKKAYRETEQFDDFLKIIPDYHKYSKIYGYKVVGEENYDCEIAFVNYRLKNYETAIKSYKKCSKVLSDDGKFFLQSSTINNIGLCFSKIRNKDSAQLYYKKAIYFINKHKKQKLNSDYSYENHFINVIESNRASLIYAEFNIERALPFYYKELVSGKKFDEKNITSSAYYNIAEVFYKKRKTVFALKYLDSTFDVLTKYNSNETKKKALNLKAKLLLIQNNFTEANKVFKLYELHVDSIDTQIAKKNYLLGAIKHETNVRTRELEESKLINEEEHKINQSLTIAVSFLVIFLAGFLLIYIRSKRQNVIIKAQTETLNETIKEKEILLKEIHHRVKNNLQVVSGLLLIQSKKNTTKNFDEILKESQRQILSMSLVHEMLYQKDNLSKIPIEEYVNKLIISLLSSYPQKEITTNISATNLELHIDYANPIGLIINELVTNSLKHGFKNKDIGIITISFLKKNNVYKFIYADNGLGLQKDAEYNNSKTFGNRLIKSLAQEMNATFEIKNGKGVTYIFNFKPK